MSTLAGPKWLALAKPPSTDEFLAHPDFRQVAAFALGWVFISSLNSILLSSLLQSFFGRASGFFTRAFRPVEGGDVEAAEPSLSEKSSSVNVSQAISDHSTLKFTLSLCFAFASLAHMSSLLTFNETSGPAACAFVIAWGGMASQAARLMAVTILILDLKRLGIKRRENILLWIWLTIGAALIFASNAITVGKIESVPALGPGKALCYRKYFPPTSLTFSLIYLLIEVYVIIRFVTLLRPENLPSGRCRDIRLLRGLSLLFLDLLTIFPMAFFTNVLADFIPFSLGALAILTAYNYSPPLSLEFMGPSPPITTAGVMSPRSTLHTIRSRISVAPTSFSRNSTRARLALPNHPFATSQTPPSSARDQSLRLEQWDGQPRSLRSQTTRTTSSNFSIDSAVMRSVRGGIAARQEKPLPSPSPEDVAEAEHKRSSSQGPLSRNILASQVQFAEQLEQIERGGPAVRTPRLKIALYSREERSRPSSGMRSPGSDIYGSDIIQWSPTRGTNDKTKQRHLSKLSHNMSSKRTSATSTHTRSFRRNSWASMSRAPSFEDLSAVRESSEDNSSKSLEPMPSRPPTFGPNAFSHLSAIEKGLPYSHPLLPGQRMSAFGSTIIGPRPLPTAVLQSEEAGRERGRAAGRQKRTLK